MAMVVGYSAMAHASLSVVGEGTINGGTTDYQLIYDSGQNITWLDYSAPAATWQNQVNWASRLTVNFNGQNVTGWSLPTTVDNSSSIGSNPLPTSSEMAYLWYTELGNTTSTRLANTGPFTQLKASYYWSSTEVTLANGSPAWYFDTSNGSQYAGYAGYGDYGLAVHTGDVVPTPIPAAAYLFGSGLLGMVGIRKKMQK